MPDEADARRQFAVPPLSDEARSMAAVLNPADEDDRASLIRLAHPEFDRALKAGLDEIDVGGQIVNMRLHLAIHQIVATQLYDDDPPEVWVTAQRLARRGFDHHEVLHMLGSTMTDQIWGAVHERRSYDPEAHLAALRALPGPWVQKPGPHAAASGDARRAARKARRDGRRRNRRR